MTDKPDEFAFSNTTGQELVRLLFQRLGEKLSPEADHFTAALGAALVLLAEVLRVPVVKARDPKQAADEFVANSARWVRELLKPATGER